MVKSLLKNKITLIILILTAAGLVSAAAYVKFSQPKPTETFLPKAEEGKATTPPQSNTTRPSAPPNIPVSETDNITVDTPTKGAKVQSGTVVQGRARVFEGRLQYRAKGNTSGVLVLSSTQVNGDSTKLQPFTFEIFFEKEPKTGETGVLEVFGYSAKDGSEIDKVILEVVF